MSQGMSEASGSGPESPSRRRLFAVLCAGAGALLLGSLGAAVSALVLAPLRKGRKGRPGRVDLGPETAFVPTRNGGEGPREVIVERTVEDGYMERRVRQRLAVVRDPAAPAGLAVLSTTCSHMGCGVSWNAEKKAFLCPCHGGTYGADGKVLSGPPPKALERLPLVVEGGRLALDAEKLG